MKGLKSTMILAMLIALPVIAYMHPLDSAAIAIILAIASTISGIILAVVSFIAKRISSSQSYSRIVIISGVLSAIILFLLLSYLLYSGKHESISTLPSPTQLLPNNNQQTERPPTSNYRPPRDSSPIPSREFLYSNEEPNERYGAYGYILFLARPNKNNYERYEVVCQNYLSHMEHLDEYEHIYTRRLMVTYWLLNDNLPNGSSRDCAALIQFYDYARAKEIASAVGALSFSGPVFVAWKYPYIFSKNKYAEHAITFDVSRFSNQDISRATKIWLSIIVDPERGLSHGTLMLAEEFRNLLQQYGKQILDFVKKKA